MSKYFLLISFLVCFSVSSPHVIAQEQKIQTFSKAAIFYKQHKRKIVSTILLVGMLGGYKLIDYYFLPLSPQQIEKNPLKALRQGDKVERHFEEKIKNEGLEDIDNIDEIIAKCREYASQAEKQYPVFLLGECEKEGWWDCLLSRIYNPLFRKTLEEKAVVMLSPLLNTQAVETVSFGSGGGFQDLMVFIKMLIKNPTAKITAHLIDRQYTPFVTCQNMLGTSRRVDKDSSLNITSVMPQLKTYAKEKWGADKKEDKVIEKNIAAHCVELECRFKQLLSYLQKRFPLANISLHIHDTVDNYFDYINKHHRLYADFIMTVDIQDEMSLLQESTYNYGKLCAKTLQQNPAAQNIWLAKNGKVAELVTIDLKKSNNTEEQKVEIEGKEIPMYIKTETITPLFNKMANTIKSFLKLT